MFSAIFHQQWQIVLKIIKNLWKWYKINLDVFNRYCFSSAFKYFGLHLVDSFCSCRINLMYSLDIFTVEPLGYEHVNNFRPRTAFIGFHICIWPALVKYCLRYTLRDFVCGFLLFSANDLKQIKKK